MPVVKVLNGPLKDKVYPIEKEKITIGRTESETIYLDEPGVSRQHAVIFRIGEMCFIRDLQSRNGTFVNDQTITEELLQAKDIILVGNTKLIFEDEGSPQSSDREVVFSSEDDSTIAPALEYRLDRQSREECGKEPNLKNLGTLYQLAKKISEIRDKGELLDEAIIFTTEALHADHGYIFIRKKSGKLVCKASSDRKSDKALLSRSIMKRVLQTNRVILTSDAATDERFRGNESIVSKRIKSVICAPLVSHEGVRGVLYLNSDGSDKTFGQEDMELASSIAIWTGIALANLDTKAKQRKEIQQIVCCLVCAMEIKIPETNGHGKRVASYAQTIAKEMDLSDEQKHIIHLGALLHDIGKIAQEPYPPNSDENERSKIYEQHVIIGEKFLSDVDFFSEVRLAVKHHHEKVNGKGFPDGLKGKDIPLAARILAVANSFDNIMSKHRKEDPGYGTVLKEALMELMRKEGEDFDEAVVAALLIAHRKGLLFNEDPFISPEESH